MSRLAVTHVIAGLDDGGAEATLYRLCSHDQQCAHHIISLMDGGKYGPLLRARGVEVDCLEMRRGRISVGDAWRLYKLIRARRPNVIQTWMYHADMFGGIVGRLAGVRRVYWGIHNGRLDQTTSKRLTLRIGRANACLSHVIPTRIICCAQQALEAHVEMGYAKQRMLVIPNGYDLIQFMPDSLAGMRVRDELGFKSTMPLLGCVARFDPAKDHRTLIQALGILKQQGLSFRMLLVGYKVTPDNPELAQWIAEAGVQDMVLLLGQRNDVSAIMNAIDLHVLSSRSEAFPNVLAEAMACGTPCVTTTVGDAAMIVGDTGWSVSSHDSAALAGAMGAALQERRNPVVWEKRRDAARGRIEGLFSIERMIERYHQAWFE